jgi:hypothetical protein
MSKTNEIQNRKKKNYPSNKSGATTRGYYVLPHTEALIDRIAERAGGNKSMALGLVVDVYAAAVEAYRPSLQRPDLAEVLRILNGIDIKAAPPSSWPGTLIGACFDEIDWAQDPENEDAPGPDKIAVLDGLIDRLRALPRHEQILLVHWVWRAWSEAEPLCDMDAWLDRLLGGERAGS